MNAVILRLASRGWLEAAEDALWAAYLQGKRKVEYATVLTPTGRVIWSGTGTSTNVELPAHVEHRVKDAIFIHNHPTHNGLSAGDIVIAIRHDMKEIRAITRDGVWSLKRPPGGWPAQVDYDRLKQDMYVPTDLQAGRPLSRHLESLEQDWLADKLSNDELHFHKHHTQMRGRHNDLAKYGIPASALTFIPHPRKGL